MINLYNEDCLQAMLKMDTDQYDLAIVDPPYGIGEDGKSNHSRSCLASSTKFKPKKWDREPPNIDYFTELLRISKKCIIWGANHFINNIPNSNSSCWLVWNKENGKNDFADCELAYTNFKTAVRMFSFRWQGMLQGNMKNKEKRIHPTQKPVALYKWILNKYAKEGDNILDTHLGSGSIAIACHDMGFSLDGYELDTEYYDAACKRLREHQRQLQLPI
jgi:site-specific DNA-methyltransferase (adenine-specific)